MMNQDAPLQEKYLPTKDFYDYEAKYEDGTTNYAIPAEVSPELQAKLEDAAIRAFKVLDCSGLVRADFFVTDEEEVIINEVNTMPGFTPISMYPKLWMESGLSYSDLIEELIHWLSNVMKKSNILNTQRTGSDLVEKNISRNCKLVTPTKNTLMNKPVDYGCFY